MIINNSNNNYNYDNIKNNNKIIIIRIIIMKITIIKIAIKTTATLIIHQFTN